MEIIKDVPDIIYRAILKQNQKYDKGDADVSVTDLCKPPRAFILGKENDLRIVKYASEFILMLEGSAVDYIISEGAGTEDIVHERHTEEINGWRVSGEPDCFEIPTGKLWDWKKVNIWEYVYGIKPDKVWQLNMYAYLFRKKYDIRSLHLGMIYSNWEKKKAENSLDSDYPPKKILTFEVEKWEEETTYNFISDKLYPIQNYLATQELPECTDEERWYRGESWACMKPGRKSAVRVFPDEQQALNYCRENNLSLVHRPGTYNRCELYCDAYPFCEQARGK
ncbi:MAG: hypothetical protein MIO92_01630 [Methanosarcinaceae archaeon]|nr:hypothetical protein [Methanosarcinaceae archaeon]